MNCLDYTDGRCKIKLLLPYKSVDNILTCRDQFVCGNSIELRGKEALYAAGS